MAINGAADYFLLAAIFFPQTPVAMTVYGITSLSQIDIYALVVQRQIFREYRLHALSSSREICGYIYGYVSKGFSYLTCVVPVENIASSSYEAIPALAAYPKYLDADYLGFYHTHLTLPFPSTTDIECMRCRPGEIWLIGGFSDARLDIPHRGRFILCAFLADKMKIRYLEVLLANASEIN